MPKVEDILKLLENGKWHDLKEIEKKTQLHDFDTTSVTRFLAEYNFIELDGGKQKAKLSLFTRNFLKKIRQLEDEEKL